MSRALRPYQEDAIRLTHLAFATVRSALLVLATGLGKTVIFSIIAKHFVSRGGVLILENTEPLVEQTAKNVASWTGLEVGIEMARRRCTNRSGRQPIVVASVMSLSQRARLEAYDPDSISLIVVDEAHHALASSHGVILDHFPAAKVLGVTATPDRHDQQALGQVFESVPFTFTLEDGIRGGWLVPIRQTRVVVESLDFSGVRTTTAGDLNEEDLARVLLEEQHLHAVVGPTLDHSGGRKTIVFAASVEHAHALARVMNRVRKGCARSIDGTASKTTRGRVQQGYSEGGFQFLVNCGMYLEGFDEAAIACVVVARPTESRALYAQMIGRGTRLCEEIRKKDLLVLDFVGNSGRHKLVSALDILGGDLEPRMREAAQLAADQGMPVLDAIAQARAQAEAEEAQKREAAIAEERRRGVVGEVRSHLVEVDAFEPEPPPPRPAIELVRDTAALDQILVRYRGRLATPKDAAFLKGHKIDARTMSFGGARNLVAFIKGREAKHERRR